MVQSPEHAQALHEGTNPSQFRDEQIRQHVQALGMATDAPSEATNESKKRRLSLEAPDFLLQLMHSIYSSLDIKKPDDDDDDLVVIEELFL